MTSHTSVQFWTELTETQTEAINGGRSYRFTINNRQSNRIGSVAFAAVGGENRSDATIGNVTFTQSNTADNSLDVRF